MGRKKATEESKALPDLAELLEAPDEVLQSFVAALDPVERQQWRQRGLIAIARERDTPAGFAAFYELVFGSAIPPHCYTWIEKIYEARGKRPELVDKLIGLLIKAFRGSTKTTTLTIGFVAWRIGREPHRSNLLIQVGDDIALDNVGQVADIIANNAGFKAVFPHVEPDRELGWGASGYQVKRNDIEYSVWRAINAGRKDPSLVGVGYKSREIIGKHPDGVLIVDDINDENNTVSEKELENVRRILTGVILPTITPETWLVAVGTPWVENDALSYLESTGLFEVVNTPVEIDGNPVWPEKFSREEIDKQRRLVGEIQFARMYLLDISRTHNKVFKYMGYPSTEIRHNWPVVGGVDYAGTWDPHVNRSGVNDMFALAYVAKVPGGGAVVLDGVIDRCTQAQAEAYVKRAQTIFDERWITAVIESDGKGEEFIQVIRRNPGMRFLPMRSGGKGKEARLVRQMSPWFENGVIKISDADTPFLNELRREMDSYPFNRHDDALDAVYWALRGMPDVLRMPSGDELKPFGERRKRETANPFFGFNGRSK